MEVGAMACVKQLFTDKKHYPNFYKCLIIFVVAFGNFYMAIFQMNQLPGDIFINFIIFGSSVTFGMILSGKINKLFQDYFVFSQALLMIFSITFVKYFTAFDDN